MDIKEYRKKYYLKNKERLREYARWYYHMKKGSGTINKPLKKTLDKKYGEFIINFE